MADSPLVQYVDVAYHVKIRAMLEGGDELAVDHWPVIVGNVGRRESNGLMSDIGYVEVLCDRPGGDEPASPSSPAPNLLPRIRSTSPNLPMSASIISIPSPQPVANNAYAPRFANLDTTHTISAATPPPHPPRSDSYNHLDREPTQQHTPQRLPVGGADPYAQFGKQAPSQRQPSPTPPRPTPQMTFHTSPTAAEEKARLHEEAIRIREERQARRVADEEQQAKRAEFLRAQSQMESPTSPSTGVGRDSLDTFIGYAEGEKASLQSAALVRRQLVQDGLVNTPTDVTAVAHSRLEPTNIARSNTTVAWNGSAVGEAGGPSPSASPTPNVVNGPSSPLHQQQQPGLQPRDLHPLLRSKTILSHAEAEKRRIYQEAVEQARVRQEEARLELERQSAALAEFESAELERLQREVDEEQAMLEEEERRRAAALLVRDEFERGERERVARVQAEWEREERERQRKAREEFEERMRAQEERRVAELARLAEQHREYEEESKAEMLRKRQQRDEEEMARRAELERLRVEREEREVAARRVAEEERAREEQAREEAERRRLEENKRRAYEERLAEEDARRRWEEEQALEHARRAHAQAAEEHRRAAEEAQRRAQEEEAAQAAAAIAAEAQRGLQLYDAPVPRNDHPIAAPRAQQPSGQGFDSNHYLPPQGCTLTSQRRSLFSR